MVQVQTSRRNLTMSAGGQSFVSTDFGQTPAVDGQALPRIVAPAQRAGETFSLDLQGETLTSVEWFAGGVTTGETGTTYTSTSTSPIFARCLIGGETIDTPSVSILPSHADADHQAMDNAIVALAAHPDADHIAIADGDWTDPATWDVGTVPSEGESVLIPIGRTVTYDAALAPRLHRVRVDGTLTWALDQSTAMLVDTIVVQPGGHIIMGDAVGNRLPAAYTATITISNRAYNLDPDNPTNLDFANDPTLVSRGIVVLGKWTAFASERDAHVKTVALGLPQATDTSVVLERAPVGWEVGDRIVIPGTAVDLDANGVNTRYDEERTITSITTTNVTNDTINFSGGLSYDHDHHNATVTERSEMQLPILNMERNIIVQSEAGASVIQRGHCMAAHGMANLDLWGVAFLNLGRTDKSIPAGIIDEDGLFRYIEAGTKVVLTTAVTATSNIQARYPIHGHFLGFGRTPTPLVRDCVVEDARAWGMVHHGCEMDWLSNAIYKFKGAGLVGETGDELGRWDNNVVCGLETENGGYRFPKGAEQNEGIRGDIFRRGYAFAYRGRANIMTRNVAVGSTWGHVFYHRGSDLEGFKPVLYRTSLDVNDLNIWNGETSVERQDYPISHFDACQSIGCAGGVAVVKANSAQGHDLNIRLTNFVAWGVGKGIGLNYIGSYLIKDALAVRSRFPSQDDYTSNVNGFDGDQNNQIAWDGVEAVDFDVGIYVSGSDILGSNNSLFSQADPRFIIGAKTLSTCTTEIGYGNDGSGTDTVDVTKIMSLPITYESRPSVSVDFIVGTFDNDTRTFTNSATLTKTDTVSNGGVIPKPWDNVALDFTNTPHTKLRPFAEKHGLWNYTDGDGTHTVLLLPYYWSDRLTAMSIKTIQAIKWTGSTSGYTNNGTFERSASDPVRADVTRNVSTGVEDSFNVLTAATGDAGTTLTLNIPMLEAGLGTTDCAHFKANYGFITVHKDGVVTYKSVPGYTGTDKMLVYVYDGKGRFCTVEISYVVT